MKHHQEAIDTKITTCISILNVERFSEYSAILTELTPGSYGSLPGGEMGEEVEEVQGRTRDVDSMSTASCTHTLHHMLPVLTFLPGNVDSSS